MSFTPKTIKHESEIGTFHMLPGKPFRANLAHKIIRNNDANGTELENAFIIIEGYVYDFIAAETSDIATYIRERANLNLQERFDLFCVVVDLDRWDILWEAYKQTRDNSVKDDEPQTDEEIVAKKNNSKAPFGKPLTANMVAGN